jgi:hypothetical protein
MEPQPPTQTTPPPPAAQPTQDDDLSKKTLVILVILSCAISLVGTIAMVYEFNNAKITPTIIENGGKATAQATLNIQPPQTTPKPTATTGYATFSLK